MDKHLLDEIFADLPPLLLRSEAAAVLRCKDPHVSDLYHRGELAGFQKAPRQGSRLLIATASLRAYIERYSR
jgi:hypothetical protein